MISLREPWRDVFTPVATDALESNCGCTFSPLLLSRQSFSDVLYVDSLIIGIDWRRADVMAFWATKRPHLGNDGQKHERYKRVDT